jgi:hypothetical protein
LKLRQPFLAVLFVCFAGVAVRADGIRDGSLKVGHGSDPSNKSDSCGLHFTIALNGNGGGIENCINTSGREWIGLEITAVISSTDTVNCTSLIFSFCTFAESPMGSSGKFDRVEIDLFGGGLITPGSKDTICAPPAPQVAPQSCFFINFNNGGTTGLMDPGGWFGLEESKGGNVKVDAIVATPEPGTILLMAASLGLLSVRRRLRLCR